MNEKTAREETARPYPVVLLENQRLMLLALSCLLRQTGNNMSADLAMDQAKFTTDYLRLQWSGS
jgi:hypothetical protein